MRRETKVIKTFFQKHNCWYYKIPDVGLGKKPFDCIFYNKKPIKLNITIPPGLHTAEFKEKSRKLLPHQIFHLSKTQGYIIWWKLINNRYHFYIEHIINFLQRIKKGGKQQCQNQEKNQMKPSKNTEQDSLNTTSTKATHKNKPSPSHTPSPEKKEKNKNEEITFL